MREKISCIIGTKNAGTHIERCMQAVSWADEIIIVDDYSSDDTLELAKKYYPTIV